jgi:hypothetical protein
MKFNKPKKYNKLKNLFKNILRTIFIMFCFVKFFRNMVKEREEWLNKPYYKKSCPIYIRS